MGKPSKAKVGIRLLIVGDVHTHWDSKLDEQALRFLKADFVLFTGDFGDEDVEVVRKVSTLNMPKAAILGNHDCCFSNKPSKGSSSDTRKWDRVNQQLNLLGDSHVGYQCRNIPDHKLSVVGLRPFAGGGETIYNPELVSHLYGVSNMQESANKVLAAAASAPKGNSLLFLGHNGPTGLGSRRTDICGKDVCKDGGDYGDPDTAQALEECRKRGLKVPLVVFGHMHRSLHLIPGERSMCVVDKKTKTVFVNGAVVPRVSREGGRHFTVVELSADCSAVLKVSEVWVSVVAGGGQPQVATEKLLFQAS